tara:strand:+ start:1824 stop:2069 length:246 start_codon:yes stop_codon:yes gene_type:complete
MSWNNEEQEQLIQRINTSLLWLQNAVDSEPSRNRIKNQLMKDTQDLFNRIQLAMKTTPELIAEILGHDSVDDLEKTLDENV